MCRIQSSVTWENFGLNLFSFLFSFFFWTKLLLMKLLAIVNFLIPLVSNREKSSDSSSTDSCSDLIFSVISGGKYCCSGYKMCLLAWEQMRKFPVEINGLCCYAIGLCDNAIGLCDNAIRSRENCILIAWQRNWIVLSHVIGECHAIGLCFTQLKSHN